MQFFNLLTSRNGDADPVQAAILQVCEELDDPHAFQGMIHLLAFIATGRRRVRLLLGKHAASLKTPTAAWLDLLDSVNEPLRNKLRANLTSEIPLEIVMVHIRNVGGLPQAFLPTSEAELGLVNHFQPVIYIGPSEEADVHYPWKCTCAGHLCQSPLDETLRSLGYMAWSVPADGKCLWHSLMWCLNLPSDGPQGSEEMKKMRAAASSYLFNNRHDPDLQQAVVYFECTHKTQQQQWKGKSFDGAVLADQGTAEFSDLDHAVALVTSLENISDDLVDDDGARDMTLEQELVDDEELVAAIQKACSSKDAAMARRVAACLDDYTKAAVFDVVAADPSKDRSQSSLPTLISRCRMI